MDDLASNSRPLLQQSSSSSDEDDDGPNKMTPSTSTDSASTALTRRLTSTSDIDGDSIAVAATARLEAGLDADDSDDDNDDDADDPTVSVNHAKELLRSENAPHDRYGFTYVVFYLLGITTLLPWNFFITASDYWMYKFRDVTNSTADGELTPIQAGFTADLSVAAAVPSTLFLILNAFIGHRIPLAWRMLGAMLLVLVFFVFTTALVEVNTDAWQSDFFVLTLASVVVMNMATALLSGALFGISGQFPSEYVTAVVSGQALGGIFAALAEIVSLTFRASATVAALVYFMIGNAVLVASIVSYAVASRTKFFLYFTGGRLALVKAASALQQQRQQRRRQRAERRRSVGSAAGAAAAAAAAEVVSTVTVVSPGADEPQFRTVLGKIWLYGFAEWLVFAVTLSVYPAVTVLVSSQSHGNGHPWNDVYFVPVVNYLVFNSGDYLGRILAGMIEWPRNKPLLVAAMAVLRIAFVPALLLCNANPRHDFPTLIHTDNVFIALMAVFSFTNGYVANIALIWAPKSVPSREREMASSMMAAFLGIGLAFGSTLSMIMVQII